ncbi:MAG: hypothetical protein JSR46_05930 [Verrucomicrobia bacterium]|nr:hypothetical protein [Verrucomicrobiota bacterium]
MEEGTLGAGWNFCHHHYMQVYQPEEINFAKPKGHKVHSTPPNEAKNPYTYLYLKEPSRGTLLFKGNGWAKNFTLIKKNTGFTNVSGGDISGQTNIKNISVEWFSESEDYLPTIAALARATYDLYLLVWYTEKSNLRDKIMTKELASIEGIKFFNNPTDCIKNFDESWIGKTVSSLYSWITTIRYIIDKKISNLFGVVSLDPSINTGDKELTKNRTILCLTGLNSTSQQYKTIVPAILEEDLSDTDLLVPQVLDLGNGKLTEMANDIFDKIGSWASSSGEKELVLVGISNGARIARQLLVKIAKTENLNIKKIHLVPIVGACKGSVTINKVKELGYDCLVSKNIAEEMPVDSPRSQQLDREWDEAMAIKKFGLQCTFIASPHDWHIPNYSSTLMEVPGVQARYALVPGHGHLSIVHAIGKVVAKVVTL